MALKLIQRNYGSAYSMATAVVRKQDGSGPAKIFAMSNYTLPSSDGSTRLDTSGTLAVYAEDDQLYRIDLYALGGGLVKTDFNVEAGSGTNGVNEVLSPAQIAAGATSLISCGPDSVPWVQTRPLSVSDLGFTPSVTTHSCGLPVGLPPSGTVGVNGAITLGTATTIVYSGGIYWYFVSGSLYSGSLSGFYFTVMSSTTSGTVYNNLYTPETNTPSVPTSPTPISGTGVAFTGVTTSVDAVSRTIVGGSLGLNGRIDCHLIGSHNNTAGNKIYILNFGGNQIYSTAATTSQAYTLPRYVTQNRSSTNRQISANAAVTSASSAPVLQTSVDTLVDQTYKISLQKSAATDFMVLESSSIVVDRRV